MGVDYSATFGIGIEIDNSFFDKFYDEDQEWIDKDGIIMELIHDTSYTYDISGWGNYTGEDNTWYIFIDEDDEQLWQTRLYELLNWANENNIPYNDYGLVGGLYVY